MMPMLDTIVSVVCSVWAIEVVAALLMYALVLCKPRAGQQQQPSAIGQKGSLSLR